MRLLRVADADADPRRGQSLEKSLGDGPAQFPCGSGNDDHVGSFSTTAIVRAPEVINDNILLVSLEKRGLEVSLIGNVDKAKPHAIESRSPAATEEILSREETRERIVAAAGRLLAQGGRDALTTRGVAAAAGVQAPTLYRLFGDKSGLLDAVAEHGFRSYLMEKIVRGPGLDPVEDLRAGWDLHVGFGLARPEVYALMYGDPRPGARSPAADEGYRILREHVRRIALDGRLRVGEERAAHLVHASGCGVVLTLLAMPEDRRDSGLSEAARETVIAAITSDAPAVEGRGPAAAAIALRAAMPDATALTEGERHVLGEWLVRLAGP
ncbi:TetR/AcrR family transcriptional regulator [bacterium]|nr:MAG: TetR/AcrR family transcriptional regulator [bacterium]